MKTEQAILRYLHIAPRKVRLLGSTLRGLPVEEAEAQLLLRPQRAAVPLLKLLRSAVANAKHNKKLDPRTLIVAAVRVDKGPILKRMLPRAQGRATPIHKIMSHVTIVLEESGAARPPKFVIVPPPKKKKSEKPKRSEKAAPKEPHKEQEAKKIEGKKESGFFKKIFRRKAV